MAVEDKMLRYNESKPKLSIVPTAAVVAITRALEYGTVKYERDDWRKGGAWTAVIDSLLRHTFAFANGENRDPESGLWHVDHVGANFAFLAHFVDQNIGKDDRFKPPQLTREGSVLIYGEKP